MIKLIIMDVDGTLTDGGIYYTSNGEEIKRFSVKDGMLIYRCNKYGIKFSIITGRKSLITERRAVELGITEIYQGISNKIEILKRLQNKYSIKNEETAYIGDDLNDLACMKEAGLKMTVADACEEVKEISDFISNYRGGDGAVRECLEFMLKKYKIYDKVISKYI
ncbi:MAG: KdsC family phosphatase [Candidatus Muiribacteriota bacterium]